MELVVLGTLGLLGFQFSKQKNNDSSKVEEIIVLEEPNKYPIEDDNLNIEEQIVHHENVQPYFTSAKTQNTNDNIKTSVMERFTGRDINMRKMEVEQKFDENSIRYDPNINTMFNTTYYDEIDTYKESVNNSFSSMNSVRPFEQEYIGPGLGLDYEEKAGMGFHDTFRILPDNVNSYNKQTFKGRVVAGKAENAYQEKRQAFEQHKPDTFYDDSKRPTLYGRSDFTAPEVRSDIDLGMLNDTHGCFEMYGNPHKEGFASQSYQVNTDNFDSTTCDYTGNPHMEHGVGYYANSQFLVHDTDREDCGQVLNVVGNNKSSAQYSGANPTQRGIENKYNGNIGVDGRGYSNQKYEANPTQRNNPNSYQGNPNMTNGGSTRNQSISVTQRGNETKYTAPAKGINAGKSYAAELNADPYLSKESVLLARAGGPQRVNQLHDPKDSISNMCSKPDENNTKYAPQGSMSGIYGKLGKLDCSTKVIPELDDRMLNIAQSQLQSNEYTVPSFST